MKNLQPEETLKNWKENFLTGLKIGDSVVENYGSFQTSLQYCVTEINNDVIKCRLIKTEQAVKLLKTNRHYCSKNMIIDINALNNFPRYLKSNTGLQDTDEVRKSNLENLF